MFAENDFEEEPRRLDEILVAETAMFDRVWYHRSLQHEYRIRDEGDDAAVERLLTIAGRRARTPKSKSVGAAFRSAAALGVDAVLVTPRCSDPLYRRSVRVSMGTVFQVPWTRIESWPAGIAELQAGGFTVASDYVVRIPMAGGVDSLNVAATAAVVFYATR